MSSRAALDVKHTGSHRGSGRYGPRLRVIAGTGRPLLVERITDITLFDIIEKRAQKLIALPHDNIVKVFSLRRTDDGKFLEIFTEMTSELPVRDILGKMGKLDALVVRNYARQLLNGLKFLHDQGLYMGGLRHEDVLLAGRGKVKISNAHTAIAGGEQRVNESAAGDSQMIAAKKKDLSSLGIIVSDLLKCVVSTPAPPTPTAGHKPRPLLAGGFTARAPVYEPRAFLKLCNTSSSAGELLAHSFCGPLPNWREQRRRLLPTATNGNIHPPHAGRHTGRLTEMQTSQSGPPQFQRPTPKGQPPSHMLASSRRPIPSGPMLAGRMLSGRLPSGRLPSGRLPSSRLFSGGRGPPDSFRGDGAPRARFPPTPRGQKVPAPLQNQHGGGDGSRFSPCIPANQQSQTKQTQEIGSESFGAHQPKDVVAVATAKHRAAIGLDPLTKRTPAQKHFLSILSSSHAPSSSPSAASLKPYESDSGGSAHYRRKKMSGLAIMHERRRVNELISNVEKFNQDLASGPTIPKLRLSALAPKPILRSYNLIGDAQISSSDEELSDVDIEEVGDLDNIL